MKHSTLMCLYGGGFLSFFLSSWSCFISFSAWSSLKRSAASVRAVKTMHHFYSKLKLTFQYKSWNMFSLQNTEIQLQYTSTYPFCTLHLHLFPFSLCCECHPPCRGKLWPDTSTQSLWNQRTALETPQLHVSSSRCYLERLWPDRLLQATT